MMRKYVYPLSILLVVVSVVLSFFIYKSFSANKEIYDFKAEINRQESFSNMLKHSLLQSIIFGEDEIKDTVRTTKGEAPLSRLIDMNTIIFRFTKESCMPCLQRELNNISLLEKEGIPILIIASGWSGIEMRALLNEYEVHSKYIILENDEQLFSFEDASYDLFLFMLTKDLAVKYLYFPVQYEDQLSKEYINYLTSLYEKNRKD